MKYCNWLDPESYSEWSLPCLRTVRQRTPERTRGKENEALSPFMSKSQDAMSWRSAQKSAHTEPVYWQEDCYGFACVLPTNTLKSSTSVPVNVTFFGNKTFAVKIRWLAWALIQYDWCSSKRGWGVDIGKHHVKTHEHTDTKERLHVKMETGNGPRYSWGYQSWKRRGKILP